MKPHWIKPGFEFIFSLSLIVIMGLPPLVFAQNTKEMEIKITNGDTVVNGKNIKDLSAAERKDAMKDIDNLGSISGPLNGRREIFIRKKDGRDTGVQKMIIGSRMNGDINDDMEMRFRSPNGNDSSFKFNYRMHNDPAVRFEGRGRDHLLIPAGRDKAFFNHRDMQTFDYNNTGSDGISTHVSFRVTDASPEKIKEITGSNKGGLEIKDLNLAPEFSSGKTLLMFSLPAHAVAEVKLTDHDGKLIWSDKAVNGNFNKSFALGLNGIYFLQVKQGGKVAVKRIMKE